MEVLRLGQSLDGEPPACHTKADRLSDEVNTLLRRDGRARSASDCVVKNSQKRPVVGRLQTLMWTASACVESALKCIALAAYARCDRESHCKLTEKIN